MVRDIEKGDTVEQLSIEILEDSIAVITEDEQDEEKLEDLITEEPDVDELEASLIHNEDTHLALDYQELFSYLTGSVKPYDFSMDSYMSYDAPEIDGDSGDFLNPGLDDELIAEILKAKKTKDQYGVEVYVNPMKKSLFDVWKLGNTAELKMRYDMIVL